MRRTIAITTRWLWGLALLLALVGMAVPTVAQQCGWKPLDSGMNDRVDALTDFDDGTGSALYAGGLFTVAGDMSAHRIAKWYGTQWSPLGSGMGGVPFPAVLALTVFDDGTGPALYIGGFFTTAGGVPANYIAKWNGLGFEPLGSGMNNQVEALSVFDDGTGQALYAGGYFTTAGGVPARYIAKWNGTLWAAVGGGMSDPVWALTAFNDPMVPDLYGLYAGGLFRTVEGMAANFIAKWDGTQWSPLGSGMSGSFVRRLMVLDFGTGPVLYAVGAFRTAGDVVANNIATWDGTQWYPLSSGMNNAVYALTDFDDGTGSALYAGGLFTMAGGVVANRIAKWDGTGWSALGSGMGGGLITRVYALTDFDDGTGPALYAGGDFTTAGGKPSPYIVAWRCEMP